MQHAFLFPGQGSQVVGMGRALSELVPEARAVFEEVDEVLGEPLSALVFDGPEERLRMTENAQPALMATSLAALRALEARTGQPVEGLCRCVAGHSLGEYSALAAARALEIGEAARLLRLRGQAMQAAVPIGEGAMAAILGLDLDQVEAVAAEAGEAGVCDVANDNAPGQVVVSGAKAAVERAVEIARSRGARRSMLLAVSAPFHCRLMAPAAEALREALAATPLRRPVVPLVTNVKAAPEDDPRALTVGLVEQVMARVRWRDSLRAMADHGIERWVELGAGKVLSGLVKRTLPQASVLALGTPDDVEAFAAGLRA